MWIKNDMHDALRHARRDRAAGDHCAAFFIGTNPFIKCASITDQHERDLSAACFALIHTASFGDSTFPSQRSLFANGLGSSNWRKKMTSGLFKFPACSWSAPPASNSFAIMPL